MFGNWGWVSVLLYRVFLVQLVPARVVSAQPAPHPVLPRVLRQTLSRRRRLCVITLHWWGLGRDWKSALQSAHLPGFAQLNSRKTKKFQDLIMALFREGEGRVVLTFKTILICHKCGAGVVMVTPKCTKRISLLSRSLCQGWGSLLKRLLM